MQHLEVSGAVRHIYIYIYVVMRLKVNRMYGRTYEISRYANTIPDSLCARHSGYNSHYCRSADSATPLGQFNISCGVRVHIHSRFSWIR